LLSEAHIDHLISRGHFSDALEAVEDHISSLREQGSDVHQRVTMLLMKSELLARTGHPERAFSVALRAASVAFKARLMPSLWNAVGQLANVLNSLGEYEAAARLLSAVIPQVRMDKPYA
jgi:anaphase-promoting complex subunit 5